MPYPTPSSPLKAIILAAGPNPTGPNPTGAETPWLLRDLGGRPMIDYVVDLARQFAAPRDIVVVTNQRRDAVATHLGPRFSYAEQPVPRGTGDAVLQAHSFLEGYDGPVLILYGDTPLLRAASIRGLVMRHRVKEATLTLLNAFTDQALPYGRVIRSANGQIVEVVESQDATARQEQIRELNIGAYMVDAPALWPLLTQAVGKQAEGEVRFTDCIRPLVGQGYTVESYQTIDESEIRGVNTDDDLEQAAFILQKRQLRPRRGEEHNLIKFGTGGWRALIGEGFTLHNVRRLCQALANDVVRQRREGDAVLIGFDRRFLGHEAAEAAAEVFAGNNVPVQLLLEDVPTPLVTYATAEHQFAYGLIFTASHNPPQWNGLKVFLSDGSLPLDEATRAIEDEANALTGEQVVKIELEIAQQSGMVQVVDYTNEYIDAIEALIDLKVIRDAGLRVILDAMHGVGQVTLDIILTEARCRVHTIHGRHDPLFGGQSPAPDRERLSHLITAMREGRYNLGLALDGDADRIAIVDDQGNFISTNQLLLLVYYYLYQVRGERGGITRNLATTHLLDRLAVHFGEAAYEVPVGFKHIANSMKKHNVLLAGESSGGLTIRGHILGKDGIFACALVVEMLARTGRGIVEMLDEIYEITGTLVSHELNLPATPEMKVMVPRQLASAKLETIAGHPIAHISHLDGTKFYLENDNWLLLRFSGTEPLLRIFVEADDDEKAQALLDWARQLVMEG